MRNLSDTIVAPITGSHPAPVGIVRLSGPDAWAIAAKVFRPFPSDPVPMMALYGCVRDGDALALPFAEGRSYTGEATVELSVHGSPASMDALIAECCLHGARFAEPGEFTYRAFMNGRIALSDAEGIADSIAAKTELQLRQAERHRSGELTEAVRRIRERILSVLASVEASVDFSEEVGELDRPTALRELMTSRGEIDGLVETSDQGRLLREGIRIVIAGRPNAGKSSLLNAILGARRAIVADLPGTTRDYVEESVSRHGLVWVLTDTAGLRESVDAIETQGIALAREAMERADCVWYLYDAQAGWSAQDEAAFASIGRPKLRIASKRDLASASGRDLAISALLGEGLEGLFEATVRRLSLKESEDALLIGRRHGPVLARASEALSSAIAALESDIPYDLAATGLQSSLLSLGEITGESASADVLEAVFSTFCIGK